MGEAEPPGNLPTSLADYCRRNWASYERPSSSIDVFHYVAWNNSYLIAIKQASLDATQSKCICLRHYRLIDLVVTFTLTNDLENQPFSATPPHMMNICCKFHWNLSTTFRDIVIVRDPPWNGKMSISLRAE